MMRQPPDSERDLRLPFEKIGTALAKMFLADNNTGKSRLAHIHRAVACPRADAGFYFWKQRIRKGTSRFKIQMLSSVQIVIQHITL